MMQRRGLFVFFYMILAAVMLTPAPALANPKYAAIVIAPDTGEVLYEANADKPRYPASLTKMMALYMAFEALERGELSLKQKLKVSKRAARQPQTNISLKAGERISLEDVIKSMVVRSANDSAVVLAEAIGKSEWNFAVMMTRKARQLGMKRTSFRNASGLPNSKQKTTARDMAKLSMALRQDFPQYYHFFNRTKFTWKGRTYTSHNKVLRYYKGADGLKTGYIRASGFNLATSVQRDGRRLVGIVMGGRKSRSRDRHMMNLLDTAFKKLEQGSVFARVFRDNIPTPQAKPSRYIAEASPLSIAGAVAARVFSTAEPAAGNTELLADTDTESTQYPLALVSGDGHPIPVAKPFAVTADGTIINAAYTPTGNWGIQVGVFREEKDALLAAANAVNHAAQLLSRSQINIQGIGQRQKTLHRARLHGLSEREARSACTTLKQKKEACFVYQLELSESL